MRASDALGHLGEDLACDFLVESGYTIVARNWRSRDRYVPGEIDIIARRGSCLAFCEVKTRTSAAFGSPAEAVTPAKAARLRRLAGVWLREHNGACGEVRVDVISVLRARSARPTIEHLKAIGS